MQGKRKGDQKISIVDTGAGQNLGTFPKRDRYAGVQFTSKNGEQNASSTRFSLNKTATKTQKGGKSHVRTEKKGTKISRMRTTKSQVGCRSIETRVHSRKSQRKGVVLEVRMVQGSKSKTERKPKSQKQKVQGKTVRKNRHFPTELGNCQKANNKLRTLIMKEHRQAFC